MTTRAKAEAAIPHYVTKGLAFLEALWSRSGGYSFIGTKCKKTGRWRDHPIDLRKGLRDAKRVLLEFPREEFDVYFTPNTFSKPTRKKEFGLRTDLAWCDIDAAPPGRFKPPPSILLKTSPGRYQGIWKWDKLYEATQAEAYSHALTYRFGGDPGGWSITKYLRLPYTFNHKKQYDQPRVALISLNLKPIKDRPELIKGINLNGGSTTAHKLPKATPKINLSPLSGSVNSIILKYRQKLHPKTRYLLRSKGVYEVDRSKQVYHMIAGLYEAGATLDEIAVCLWPNPYFVSKYGQDEDKLAEEIERITGKLER